MLGCERVAQLGLTVFVQLFGIEFILKPQGKLQRIPLDACIDDRGQCIAQIIFLTPELSNQRKLHTIPFFIVFQGLVKLLDELFILDDVCRRDGPPTIEVHDAFEVNVKFILVDDDDTIGDSVQRERKGLSSYISNHYYRMIGRYINLSRLTQSIRFSFGFFTKTEGTDNKLKVPLFKKDANKPEVRSETPKANENSRAGLEDLINKINESNKYFLGVKLNTNYLKVNNVAKFQQISQQKLPSVQASDLPIEFTKQKGEFEAFDSLNQANILNKKAAQIAFAHCRAQRAIMQMQELIRLFIVSLAGNERFIRVEPNFEANAIKIRNSIAEKFKLKVSNENQLPQIKIKDITLLKGLSVYRNENYSTDSYQKNESQATDGFINYVLYRQQKEKYPQSEWFSTKKINARFEVLVRGGPSIEVFENGTSLGSSGNLVHNVVVEADLVAPPAISEHQLTTEQFLRSYRLRPSDLMVTNFDRKNSFYSLTYTESEKKSILINKIE